MSRTVYVTPTGTEYHLAGCPSLRAAYGEREPIETDRDLGDRIRTDARELGPCGRCVGT